MFGVCSHTATSVTNIIDFFLCLIFCLRSFAPRDPPGPLPHVSQSSPLTFMQAFQEHKSAKAAAKMEQAYQVQFMYVYMCVQCGVVQCVYGFSLVDKTYTVDIIICFAIISIYPILHVHTGSVSSLCSIELVCQFSN